ncbi:iron-sulfur cluster assembly protein [Streptomyces sp. M19]
MKANAAVKADVDAVRGRVEAVPDPELPVISLGDLGVIRDVARADDGVMEVTITPTYTGCPAMETIQVSIRAVLAACGHPDGRVRQVLSPAWTTDWISADGLRKLADNGIARRGPPERPCPSASGPACAAPLRLRGHPSAEHVRRHPVPVDPGVRGLPRDLRAHESDVRRREDTPWRQAREGRRRDPDGTTPYDGIPPAAGHGGGPAHGRRRRHRAGRAAGPDGDVRPPGGPAHHRPARTRRRRRRGDPAQLLAVRPPTRTPTPGSCLRIVVKRLGTAVSGVRADLARRR